jgi:hypothetical protein
LEPFHNQGLDVLLEPEYMGFSAVLRGPNIYDMIQWKLLIMITLGLTLFDNNNWLITLSGGYKNLHI